MFGTSFPVAVVGLFSEAKTCLPLFLMLIEGHARATPALRRHARQPVVGQFDPHLCRSLSIVLKVIQGSKRDNQSGS